jgi:two-component system, NarL family, response regulator LiaR
MKPTPAKPSARLDALPARRRQVLLGLKAGKLRKEIAAELGITVGTVHRHCEILYKELRVHNKVEAAALCNIA